MPNTLAIIWSAGGGALAPLQFGKSIERPHLIVLVRYGLWIGESSFPAAMMRPIDWSIRFRDVPCTICNDRCQSLAVKAGRCNTLDNTSSFLPLSRADKNARSPIWQGGHSPDDVKCYTMLVSNRSNAAFHEWTHTGLETRSIALMRKSTTISATLRVLFVVGERGGKDRITSPSTSCEKHIPIRQNSRRRRRREAAVDERRSMSDAEDESYIARGSAQYWHSSPMRRYGNE
jgi:hypothetical protein